MDLKDVGGLLGQVAPTLATALGGPLAGLAVKTISNVLLGGETGKESDIAAALAGASPEQLAALKKVDADFNVRMKELDIDLGKIAAGDRDSARQREIKTGDWTPRVLAFVMTAGFFCTLVYMMKYGLPTGDGKEALLILLGALSTAFGTVIAYYFGTSASSAKKDDTIRAIGASK